MDHPLSCQCGTIRGHLTLPSMAGIATCYCKDCQAYAHALGVADRVLDGNGGTRIVAMLPERVVLTQGHHAIECLSLSDKGLLRWYASCCSTPIGNTPRDRALPYVGVVHTCLEQRQPTLEASFGPARIAINTASARGDVPATPVRAAFGILRIMRATLGAKLRGAVAENPFFDKATAAPIREPRVLDPAERTRLTPA